MAFVFEEYSKGAPSGGIENDEVIILSNDGSPAGFRTINTLAQNQCVVNTYLVETLPDTLELSVMAAGGTVHLYVVKSTGIVYGDLGAGTMTLSVALFNVGGYDKGWVSELPAQSEVGIYVMWKSDIFKDGNTIYLENALGEDTITLSPLDWVKVQSDFSNTSIHFKLNTGDGYIDDILCPSAIFLNKYCYGCVWLFHLDFQIIAINIEGGVATYTSKGIETF